MGTQSQSHSSVVSYKGLSRKSAETKKHYRELFYNTSAEFMNRHGRRVESMYDSMNEQNITHTLYHMPGRLFFSPISALDPKNKKNKTEDQYFNDFIKGCYFAPYKRSGQIRFHIDSCILRNAIDKTPLRRAVLLENIVDFYKDNGSQVVEEWPCKTLLDEAIASNGAMRINQNMFVFCGYDDFEKYRLLEFSQPYFGQKH
jgi:hypothetical protein